MVEMRLFGHTAWPEIGLFHQIPGMGQNGDGTIRINCLCRHSNTSEDPKISHGWCRKYIELI